MNASDFLKLGAETPLREFFNVRNAVCEIRTNHETILRAARESFLPVRDPEPEMTFGMRFWVDSRAEGRPPWPAPYVRRSGHLVYAGFDSGSSALIHLGSRRAIGRFSPAIAEDCGYWKESILPTIFSIFRGASDVVSTETPYATSLPVMGRIIRLETNDIRILERAEAVFASYSPGSSGNPHFLWRIVSQPGPALRSWPARSAFSGHGLRFAAFGQTNFMAVDLDARQSIGYVADGLVRDELELTNPFLDHMFSMTAGSLGLTSLFAACVGQNGDALLIVGPPNNCKTSASYIAARNGLEFHADRALFLEVTLGRLCAWGDFWPAVFRPDGLKFYPELRAATRSFRYSDFTFYHLDKGVYQKLPARAVTPVACVFMDRQAAETPMLSRIPSGEFSRRLHGLDTFQDDSRFDAQRSAVLDALETLPAYEFVFDDPADAARVFGDLLNEHKSPPASGLDVSLSPGVVEPVNLKHPRAF